MSVYPKELVHSIASQRLGDWEVTKTIISLINKLTMRVHVFPGNQSNTDQPHFDKIAYK